MRKNKVLLALGSILLVGILLIAGTLGLVSHVTRAEYPVAPTMPPVVNQSMEEILAQLEAQLKSKAPQVLINLQPGLSMERITDLEKQAGVQIPDEIKVIYHWRNGLNRATDPTMRGPMPGDFFMPLDEALEASRILTNQVANATPLQRGAFNVLAGFTKQWIVLFDDGAGDGYFYDPSRKPAEGAIFFHFMEEGDYTFFPSPKNLFAGMVECYRTNAFVWKEETNGGSLTEDFNASEKVWSEFGAKPHQ